MLALRVVRPIRKYHEKVIDHFEKPRNVGTIKNSDNVVYGCDFNYGNLNSKIIYVNDDIYEGEFKDGQRNGYGKMICLNGDIMEGYFHNDKLNGLGKIICKNGDIMEGEFKDNYLN